MPVLQRGSTSSSIIDMLDHILDKGIVIDAWVAVSVAGIDLLTVEARVVVASIDTYASAADDIARVMPAVTRLPGAAVPRSRSTSVPPAKAPLPHRARAH